MNTVTQKQVDAVLDTAVVQTIEACNKKITIVVVEFPNGFTCVESSTCVDMANFSEQIGKEMCLERLEDKVWMMLGYSLQDKLYNERGNKCQM